MQGIDFVAWWGAIVATGVLVWDVAKWFRSGPIMVVRTKLHVGYLDSRVVRSVQTENGEEKELAEYCHIEVVNRGALPTTVIGIRASHEPGESWGQASYEYPAFEAHYGKDLPQLVEPGAMWSCRFEMSNLYQLSERGAPYIEVLLSHEDAPRRIWPLKAANKPLQATQQSCAPER